MTVSDTVFSDYGLRPELWGKLDIGAPFSWISIGNPAAPESSSSRREAVVRTVFLDEGALFGLSSIPFDYLPATVPIDLLYVSGLFMNVSNLGTSAHYLRGPQRLLIENSHYGYSHNADSAINLLSVGNAILDQVECVAGANRIRADAATGKLTVINSVYTFLDSQSPATRVITTESPEDDPVQYVRSLMSLAATSVVQRWSSPSWFLPNTAPALAPRESNVQSPGSDRGGRVVCWFRRLAIGSESRINTDPGPWTLDFGLSLLLRFYFCLDYDARVQSKQSATNQAGVRSQAARLGWRRR